MGERADPIHRCACRSHTHTCQHVNLHTWSGLSSLKTEMMINREKCCQPSRARSYTGRHPLSLPIGFHLSLELSLWTSLSSQDPSLSLARTYTDTHTHTHTHTHPGSSSSTAFTGGRFQETSPHGGSVRDSSFCRRERREDTCHTRRMV